MDIVVICNGLGNQMSQYAFFLSKKHIEKNTRFIFDKRSKNEHNGFELERLFDINYKDGLLEKFLCFVLRVLAIKKYPTFTQPALKFLKFLGIRLINENYDYDFNEKYLRSSKGLNIYYGGWHSEKYFLSVKAEVKDVFRFKLKASLPEFDRVIERIKTTSSVAVHIRRGDFLTGINYSMFGAVCTESYFDNAIQKMQSLTHNPHFFIFTNDVEWSKKRFSGLNFEIVTCNQRENSWRDMYLISLCKHCINSNSSFSWWGAWLNSNSDRKVIVPYFFLNKVVDKDVYPHDWIRISNIYNRVK